MRNREHTLQRDTYKYEILLLQVHRVSRAVKGERFKIVCFGFARSNRASGIFTFVQVVRMLDFHSRDTGSNPVRETPVCPSG